MRRTSINAVDRGLACAMERGAVTSGASRRLRCSGQVAVVPDPAAALGVRVVAPNDMRSQFACAPWNVDAVLDGAAMTCEDIVAPRFPVTDSDAFPANCDVYTDRLGAAGIRPPQGLTGVACRVLPELMVVVGVEAAR